MKIARSGAGAAQRARGPAEDGSGGSSGDRVRKAGGPAPNEAPGTGDRAGASPDSGLGAARGILVGLGLVTPAWMVALAWLVSCQIAGKDDCGEMGYLKDISLFRSTFTFPMIAFPLYSLAISSM